MMAIEEWREYNRLYMREWRRLHPDRAYEIRVAKRRRRHEQMRRCFGCGRLRALQNLRIIERMAITESRFIPARKFWCGEC